MAKRNVDLRQMLTPQRLFSASVSIAGLSLLVLGTRSKDAIMATVGGAMFGSTVGTILDNLFNTGFRQDIVEILRVSLGSSMQSDEARLARYRRKIYYYHMTERSNQALWRCDKLDFSSDASVGTLSTVSHLTTPDGMTRLKQTYRVVVRDKRFLLFRQTEDSEERVGVAVLPHLGEQFGAFDCGVVFKQTWDGRDVVAPCIIAFTPLVTDCDGGFVPDEDFAFLSSTWSNNFWKRNAGCGPFLDHLTPSASSTMTSLPAAAIPAAGHSSHSASAQ